MSRVPGSFGPHAVGAVTVQFSTKERRKRGRTERKPRLHLVRQPRLETFTMDKSGRERPPSKPSRESQWGAHCRASVLDCSRPLPLCRDGWASRSGGISECAASGLTLPRKRPSPAWREPGSGPAGRKPVWFHGLALGALASLPACRNVNASNHCPGDHSPAGDASAPRTNQPHPINFHA